MISQVLFSSQWEIFRQTYYFSLRNRKSNSYKEIPFSMLFTRNHYFSRIPIKADVVMMNLGFDIASLLIRF